MTFWLFPNVNYKTIQAYLVYYVLKLYLKLKICMNSSQWEGLLRPHEHHLMLI